MDRLRAWERRADLPLTFAALAFLLAYAAPIVRPDLPAELTEATSWTMTITWVAFAVDFAARLWLAPARLAFLRANLLDVAVIALPLLRPLRLLRLIALLSVLNRTGARTLRGRVAVYVVGGTALLVLTGALAVTDAERGVEGANIATFGDGLWWALTTITTVGYGDRFPVTVVGRGVAVALMVGGIALLGVVTAALASWLVERVAAESEREEAATRAQVESLSREVAALRARLGADDKPV